MTDLPDIRHGDRVRVTMEGFVKAIDQNWVTFDTGAIYALPSDYITDRTIEVLGRALPREPEIGSSVLLRQTDNPTNELLLIKRQLSGTNGWWLGNRFFSWAEICALGTLLVIVHADARVEVVT